ncbi:MAG TPA: holo-ACP synthase [Polyangiaceae bacterium]|nr:holo-ACP synthase [Polyangiaceae bacterium]
MTPRVGLDLVDLVRFHSFWGAAESSQLLTVFTASELAYAQRKRKPVASLAGRFAAKEAVLKVLGELDLFAMDLTGIEVVAVPSNSPKVHLSGAPAELAAQLGIEEVAITISHTKQFASAVALALTRPARRFAARQS